MGTILLGFLIGVAIGTTGVGGGVLTAPALILFLGLGPRVAVATALAYSAIVKIFAAGVYFWRRNVHWATLGVLLAGGVPGAIMGALALERIRRPAWDRWILVAVGATVVVSAGGSLYRQFRTRPRPRERRALLGLLSFPIGLEVGFSSAGAGALGSVLLFSCTRLEPVAVVGTDLAFGMILSAVGGGIHIAGGSCDWPVLWRLLPAGAVGTFVGARLARQLPAKLTRTLVLIWAAVLGVVMVGRAW
jgi:uncharacterized membrane protein YfcA